MTLRSWNALAAVAVLVVTATGVTLSRHFAASPAPVTRDSAPSGAFRLDDDQLRSLSIESVAKIQFHSEVVTDGKIAFDDNALTQVFSPLSGRVTRLIAAPGAYVRRGEPLFEIDASEYAQGAADLLAALAQQKLAATSEARKHAAYDAHGGSLQDWQQAQNDLAVASATLAAVRDRLRIMGVSEKSIDAIGEHGRADAAIPVTAPISGVVVGRQIGPGQVLQPNGSNAVYTIADLSSVWLIANVREGQAPQMRAGQAVSVNVLALPDREFKARLDYVAAAVDPASRRVQVHATLKNPDGELKPEMLATMAIRTSADAEGLAIPKDAVIYEGDSARVWVMLSDHEAGLREVQVGREREGKIEVLDGLVEGERVVTRGALFIDRAARG